MSIHLLVTIYHPDSFPVLPAFVADAACCVTHNLQESFPVGFLPYASCELALQAVLQCVSERVKNGSCQACLSDCFTRFKNLATAFSMRVVACPLRFVNAFDAQNGLFFLMSDCWYSLRLCMLSTTLSSSRFSVALLFCQLLQTSSGKFSYTPYAIRQFSCRDRGIVLLVGCFLTKKDERHFFSFHLTRIHGHGVFVLSRRVPSQGALTERKGCGTLGGQVENEKSFSSHLVLCGVLLGSASLVVLVFTPLLRYPISKSGSAKYISGWLVVSLLLCSVNSAESKPHCSKCICLLAFSFSCFLCWVQVQVDACLTKVAV